MNYFKLSATSKFLEPKKLLLSFPGFLYSLILFPFADHSQIGISCPVFFFKLRLRRAHDHWPCAPGWSPAPHTHHFLFNLFLLQNSSSPWDHHSSKYPGQESGGKSRLLSFLQSTHLSITVNIPCILLSKYFKSTRYCGAQLNFIQALIIFAPDAYSDL